eukprot:4890814-Pleurochrysis_carterae.AAC.2
MLLWGVEGEGVLDAFVAADRYKALVGRLGSAWPQQKWRASRITVSGSAASLLSLDSVECLGEPVADDRAASQHGLHPQEHA